MKIIEKLQLVIFTNNNLGDKMFDKYLKFALNKAEYKMLESGEWFASITGYDGIWATGISVE